MKLTLNLLFEIKFFFFEKQTKMYLVQSQSKSDHLHTGCVLTLKLKSMQTVYLYIW